MKQLRFIALTLMTLPFGLWAQEERIMDTEVFYEILAQKDAQYELSYNFTSDDDERDFWKDQKSFENALALKDNTAYQFYIKHKSKFYQNHKSDCIPNCLHSELFIKHASFYMKSYKEKIYLDGIALVNDN
jgi:hypothetical protein